MNATGTSGRNFSRLRRKALHSIFQQQKYLEHTMTSIGFIGLGAMGLPMAKRLLAAGHALTVSVHKNRAPAEEIGKLGGRIAASISELVTEAEVVVSIIPDDAQLEALFLAPEVLHALRPGTLVIEMTTATPAVMRKIAEALAARGANVLDAPVSGGVKGAADGTLTIMCGGDAAVYAAALPILQHLGAKTPLVGGMAAGKALKAVNQLLVGVNTVVVAEALCLARKMGVDLEVMRDVISASSGNSTAFMNKFQNMVNADYTPRFTGKLMRKDIGIAMAEGRDLALPLTVLANHLYGMMPPEMETLDYSAIAALYTTK